MESGSFSLFLLWIEILSVCFFKAALGSNSLYYDRCLITVGKFRLRVNDNQHSGCGQTCSGLLGAAQRQVLDFVLVQALALVLGSLSHSFLFFKLGDNYSTIL